MLNLSAFQTQGQLGNLAAATLAFGWLCDVTLTPALCSGLRIVTLWELLTLDLGSEPQRTIGLFRGLTAAQARIVALMGALVPVRGGERLWRAGEPADALYVVIDGKLRASVEREGGVRELAVHGRGDVLGEVGLAQHARSADIDALEDGRLLRLDPGALRAARAPLPAHRGGGAAQPERGAGGAPGAAHRSLRERSGAGLRALPGPRRRRRRAPPAGPGGGGRPGADPD